MAFSGALFEEQGRKRGVIAHVGVPVYLRVKWLVDVHSVVLALFDEHVPTFPDESCGRVGVDGAAQEHRLL